MSSGMKPQYGDATEHSCGGLKKLTGRAPPPRPTMVRWPRTRATCAGHPQGRVYADDVQHELRALPPRHVLDARDRLVARKQRLVRAHAPGDRELVLRGVHGDDGRGRAERTQDLDGHLAEAARPDHHRGRARPEQVERPLDGVIAGERRVGERGGLAGIEGPQRNQEARRRDEQVRGHPAVFPRPPAEVARVLAVVLHTEPAVCAGPAAPGAVDDHGVPGREPGRAWPSFSTHPAFSWPSVNGSAGAVRGRVHEMQVGVAGARPPTFIRTCPGPARAPAPRAAPPASAVRPSGMLACYPPFVRDLSLDPVDVDQEMARAAEDLVAAVRRRVLDEPRVLHAAEELADRGLDLQPRERSAEAVVDALAVADVLVVRALEVELVGVLEPRRVAVRRAVAQEDRRARRDGGAGDLDVLEGRARVPELDRGLEAQQLLAPGTMSPGRRRSFSSWSGYAAGTARCGRSG